MTTGFFNAVVLAVAKSIAAQFTAGDVQAASNRLEMHIHELSAGDSAAFISKGQQFIEKVG